ncbi:hypothetical protein T440DRAFT_514792 [Plenodomus tracheiphilus IPT5]|uniref:Uncharacterized protein n=1 Tax=Plenodomus tracheiphilus IPT5 TaxID=1408161 RepID=A0A6A7BF61_9PLEO|nr:hypothetical protein T440DRAFT_514792 [Plenodomus tracheiphilus IPT5]
MATCTALLDILDGVNIMDIPASSNVSSGVFETLRKVASDMAVMSLTGTRSRRLMGRQCQPKLPSVVPTGYQDVTLWDEKDPNTAIVSLKDRSSVQRVRYFANAKSPRYATPHCVFHTMPSSRKKRATDGYVHAVERHSFQSSDSVVSYLVDEGMKNGKRTLCSKVLAENTQRTEFRKHI